MDRCLTDPSRIQWGRRGTPGCEPACSPAGCSSQPDSTCAQTSLKSYILITLFSNFNYTLKLEDFFWPLEIGILYNALKLLADVFYLNV